MADLHKKLAMRRKGISGTKENGAQTGATSSSMAVPSANLMDSISSMIPPPPKPDTSTGNTDRSDNDSDWE